MRIRDASASERSEGSDDELASDDNPTIVESRVFRITLPESMPFLRRTLVPITLDTTKPTAADVGDTKNTQEILVTTMHVDEAGKPSCRSQAQRGRNCPFCLFDTKTDNGILKHCLRFHSDHHVFDAARATDGILHMLARPRKFRTLDPLFVIDFKFVRLQSETPDLKRKQRAGVQPSTKRRRMLPVTMGPVFSNAKPMVTNAKRQYYHSRSRLPLNSEHLDVDSDEESEDEWVDVHAQAGLNEFVDVTEPEKVFLNLWKRFIRSDTIMGDQEVPKKCSEFVETHLNSLKYLRTQLLMHLITLWENKIISSDHLLATMNKYDELQKTTENGATDSQPGILQPQPGGLVATI